MKLSVYPAGNVMVAIKPVTVNENGPVIVRVVGIEKRCTPESHAGGSTSSER